MLSRGLMLTPTLVRRVLFHSARRRLEPSAAPAWSQKAWRTTQGETHGRHRYLYRAFIDELRDAYDGERQLTKALPKLAKAATAPALKKAPRSSRTVW